MPRTVYRGQLTENNLEVDEPITLQAGSGDACTVAAFPRLCIGEKQLPGLLEIRRDNEIEQSSLPHRRDFGNTSDFLQATCSIDALQATGPLGDEHAPIRQVRETPGMLQSCRDRPDFERDGRRVSSFERDAEPQPNEPYSQPGPSHFIHVVL